MLYSTLALSCQSIMQGKTLEAALDLAKSVAINSPISVQGCVLTLRSNKVQKILIVVVCFYCS